MLAAVDPFLVALEPDPRVDCCVCIVACTGHCQQRTRKFLEFSEKIHLFSCSGSGEGGSPTLKRSIAQPDNRTHVLLHGRILSGTG